MKEKTEKWYVKRNRSRHRTGIIVILKSKFNLPKEEIYDA